MIITTTTTTDKILWKHSKDGVFSVNIAYKRGLMGMTGAPKYNWNYFWKSDIPTKVKCFTWLVIKRACLIEVLQKKGRQLVPRCFLCNFTGKQITISLTCSNLELVSQRHNHELDNARTYIRSVELLD
ncbi:hypothetical protein MTR67_014664 [Solanum verrucosum]|uniref:Reverse transcriptase zinc-binding domain-containing protein n=1 Tax=Solanum verrucosum TaxID=315347 RepID=A0AAF0TJG2_SOLVR|nr:hypothetical protein MTR67_014664 [Solanum verrucosum]